MAAAASSSSSWGSSRKPYRAWHKSLDSQEFGFASNLVDSPEVAPADELFYKGQLLPLQLDQVLVLSSDSHDEARLCCREVHDDDVKFDSCRMDNNSAFDGDGGGDEDVKFNSCRMDNNSAFDLDGRGDDDVKFNSCRMDNNSAFDLDGGGGGGGGGDDDDDDKDKGPSMMMGSTYMLPRPKNMVDLQRSSSYRSEHSAFWESGPDKGDTSNAESSASSSRDSDGSSQDSFFRPVNHHHKNEPPFHSFAVTASHIHHHHSDTVKDKGISSITRRPLFRKAPRKQYSRSAFSEDLSIRKVSPCEPFSLNQAQKVKPPLWKQVNSNRHEFRSSCQTNASAVNDGCLSKLVLSDSFGECQESAVHGGLYLRQREPQVNFCGSGNVVTVNATMARKTRRTGCSLDENEGVRRKVAVVRQRWQELYAKKLKPLVEINKGLIGQFKMDNCGKRASCQVETGSIYAFSRSSLPLQRRLSHQSSLFNSHKLQQYQEYWAYHGEFGTVPGNSTNMLVISSCPPSSRSSPTHSGDVAAINTAQRGFAYNFNKGFTNRGINIYAGLMKNKTEKSDNTSIKSKLTFASSNYTSVSTKQDLHTSLQSAIAHCKESYNRKLNQPD